MPVRFTVFGSEVLKDASGVFAEFVGGFVLAESESEALPSVSESKTGEGEAVERERESGGVRGEEVLPRSEEVGAYDAFGISAWCAAVAG